MKHWLLFLLFLMLLAPSVSAGSWLDTRTDYYTAARVKMGFKTTSTGALTDTAASLLWNEAVAMILPVNRGIKRLTTIVTSYRESTYALDSTLIDIEAVWFDSVGIIKPMKYLPVRFWRDQPHINADGTPNPFLARPSFFDYTDSVLIIYPTPGQTTKDTMTVMGWHRLADVDTVTVSGVIPEMYRLAILYHMVWNHAKARGDNRVGAFKEELSLALNQIGLKLTRGGQVVADGS